MLAHASTRYIYGGEPHARVYEILENGNLAPTPYTPGAVSAIRLINTNLAHEIDLGNVGYSPLRGGNGPVNQAPVHRENSVQSMVHEANEFVARNKIVVGNGESAASRHVNPQYIEGVREFRPFAEVAQSFMDRGQ
jgi:hypothetical protein